MTEKEYCIECARRIIARPDMQERIEKIRQMPPEEAKKQREILLNTITFMAWLGMGAD